MDRHTHHTPARAQLLAQMAADLDATRIEVSAAIDAYVVRVLDTWLMPQIDADLAAACSAPTAEGTTTP